MALHAGILQIPLLMQTSALDNFDAASLDGIGCFHF
jgi:hypothetical protein